MLIPRSFTVDNKLYPLFRKECSKRSIAISKWLRNQMKKQMEEWTTQNTNQ